MAKLVARKTETGVIVDMRAENGNTEYVGEFCDVRITHIIKPDFDAYWIQGEGISMWVSEVEEEVGSAPYN